MVLTDRSKVRGRIRHLKHPLGDANGVLGGTSGDVLDLVVLLELGVEGLVLVLGENLVAELELVLVEERLVNDSADVEQGVSTSGGEARACEERTTRTVPTRTRAISARGTGERRGGGGRSAMRRADDESSIFNCDGRRDVYRTAASARAAKTSKSGFQSESQTYPIPSRTCLRPLIVLYSLFKNDEVRDRANKIASPDMLPGTLSDGEAAAEVVRVHVGRGICDGFGTALGPPGKGWIVLLSLLGVRARRASQWKIANESARPMQVNATCVVNWTNVFPYAGSLATSTVGRDLTQSMYSSPPSKR